MPSPDNSPRRSAVGVTSPSAIRRGMMSPTNPAATQVSTSQWQITRVHNTSTQTSGTQETPHADTYHDVDDFAIDGDPASPIREETGQSAIPRRTIVNVMRSAVPESRRRSRAQSQAAAAAFANTTTGGNTQQQQQSDELFSSFVMQLANGSTSGAQGFEAIANNIANQRQGTNLATRTGGDRQYSPLRHKLVYQLRCTYCAQRVCNRAMKAILLADTKIELYSTDIPPSELQMMNEDRMTHGCHCRIRDTVCGCCGNILGYHVSQPCERCLDAKNNGHFWMFYSETVQPYERPDPSTGKSLFWGSLSPMREFEEILLSQRYETFCR